MKSIYFTGNHIGTKYKCYFVCCVIWFERKKNIEPIVERCCEWFQYRFIVLFTCANSCRVEFVKVQPSIVFLVNQIKFGCSGRVHGGSGAACCQKLRLEKLVPPLPAFNTVRPGKHSHFPLPFSQEWPDNPPVPSLTLLHTPPRLLQPFHDSVTFSSLPNPQTYPLFAYFAFSLFHFLYFPSNSTVPSFPTTSLALCYLLNSVR